MYCIECNCYIGGNVRYSSNQYLGFPLCREHQAWIRNHQATEEAIELYFLLKKNKVPAVLEKHDDNKIADIVIEKAKVHIAVDDRHNNYDHNRALDNLKKTFHSFKKGYVTLRIPNALIQSKAEETANYISEFLALKQQQKKGFSIRRLFG